MLMEKISLGRSAVIDENPRKVIIEGLLEIRKSVAAKNQ
jgi:hypothetical protein